MQIVDTPQNFIEGIFVKELKNRFLCEVIIDGVSTICYVPSSCHLSNFLSLEGKQVLLVPTQTLGSRTPYSLFAVPYKRNYIILNTSMANRAIENSIHSRRFYFLGERKIVIKEHMIEGYKADLFLPETNTIFEIKSIISTKHCANFPSVYSERTLQQLDAIRNLLLQNHRVCLAIVSLHPYLKSINIDNGTAFHTKLVKCLDAGLILKAYTSRLHYYKAIIDKEIPIELQ